MRIIQTLTLEGSRLTIYKTKWRGAHSKGFLWKYFEVGKVTTIALVSSHYDKLCSLLFHKSMGIHSKQHIKTYLYVTFFFSLSGHLWDTNHKETIHFAQNFSQKTFKGFGSKLSIGCPRLFLGHSYFCPIQDFYSVTIAWPDYFLLPFLCTI